MQNIKRELRDRRSKRKHQDMLRGRATALRPAFTQKDFHYVHIGPFTKGPPPRNYNSTLGVHNSSLSLTHLYTRGRH